MQDVFYLPSKSLGDFKREHGKDWVVGYVSMWLINLNDSANVKQKMSDVQIEFTAERIYESYSLKVTDLTLFFRNVKEGVYGQYYENLDSSKIMEWLGIYFNMRCEYAEMYGGRSNEKINVNTIKVHPEVIKKMFEGVGETKVEHNQKGGGLGSRLLKVDLVQSIKAKTTEELKKYLLDNDVKSKTHDEFIISLVEKELDIRNKNNG